MIFQNANEIAERIASSLIKIHELGYFKFHLVGFSLGAQISGLIGRKLIQKSGNKVKIPRITGLDPGKLPPFVRFEVLNAGDALFVDTIHVETQFFGTPFSTGNSSFWVNGAISQPMCKKMLQLSKFQKFNSKRLSN